MEDLKTLYEKRDKRYTKESKKIFKLINTMMECVTNHLSDMDESIFQGNISWEETSLMDDMVIIIGMLSYDLGDVIDVGGIEINVTEDNIHELQQMLHMAVPIKLVEEGDSKKITAYLQTITSQHNVDVDVVELPHSGLDNEFDLSELSEEQRENLRLSTLKSGH